MRVDLFLLREFLQLQRARAFVAKGWQTYSGIPKRSSLLQIFHSRDVASLRLLQAQGSTQFGLREPTHSPSTQVSWLLLLRMRPSGHVQLQTVL